MAPGALAVFVKTPGLSPVKTRLAAGMGKEVANNFYLKALNCIEGLMTSLNGSGQVEPFWALAEKVNENYTNYWQSFPQVIQSPGGLGERLSSVYDKLLENHPFVVFMGADSPHIPEEKINNFIDEFRKLQAKDPMAALFGPTFDGGFYLFACGAPLDRESWTKDVSYSTSETLAQLTESLLAKGINVHKYQFEFDVDTQDELQKLAQLPLSDQLNNSQQQLIRWAQTLF